MSLKVQVRIKPPPPTPHQDTEITELLSSNSVHDLS